MSAQSIDDITHSPRRPWWTRRRRPIIAAAAVALAAGAFLYWGPIGLGAGPLFVGQSYGVGGPDQGLQPVGIIIPIHNSSHDAAVIDGIRLVGRTRYPGPHVIRLEAWSVASCGGAWPVSATARSFVLRFCGGQSLGPLIGHAFGFTKPVSPGYGAAFEISPPRPGSCWVLTDVVVHYHVGIKHYSATDPASIAVCAGRHPSRLVSAAMKAAQSAGPG